MRTIKFRGKIKNDPSYRPTNFGKGVWVVGLVSKRPCIDEIYANKFYIHTGENEFEVDPETIGQFTGLKDKNGNEIYEDDIVKTVNNYVIPSMECTGIVEFKRGAFRLNGEQLINAVEFHKAEVIGNIHDNPEFLKKEEE